MHALLEKPRTSNVTVKLDGADRARLSALASIKNRSTHFIMKEAIQTYLVKEEAQQAEIHRAEQSIAHYKATGLHITLDELSTWVQAIQVNPEAPVPACHT